MQSFSITFYCRDEPACDELHARHRSNGIRNRHENTNAYVLTSYNFRTVQLHGRPAIPARHLFERAGSEQAFQELVTLAPLLWGRLLPSAG